MAWHYRHNLETNMIDFIGTLLIRRVSAKNDILRARIDDMSNHEPGTDEHKKAWRLAKKTDEARIRAIKLHNFYKGYKWPKPLPVVDNLGGTS